MTGIDPERLERRLRWAAEQLGLSPHASSEEARAAWLRRLPEDDFVPSSESRWALAALLRRPQDGGWEARADEAAFVAEEERLRDEVETFATQFWDIPVGERRRRWEELRDRCAFAPALRARLRLLEPGLAVEARIASEDERVIHLANHVREIFVLRPGLRARARQEILHGMRKNRQKWKAAAQNLRHACPEFASLGDDLLDRLRAAKAKTKKTSKGASKPRPVDSLDPPQPHVSRPRAAKSRQSRPRWLLMLLAPLLLVLLRLACSEKDSPDSNPRFRFNDPIFAPEDLEQKLRLELWKQAAEQGLLQNEEFRKELNKSLDERMKDQPRNRNGDKQNSPSEKSP